MDRIYFCVIHNQPPFPSDGYGSYPWTVVGKSDAKAIIEKAHFFSEQMKTLETFKNDSLKVETSNICAHTQSQKILQNTQCLLLHAK